jgi:hypothetical protein
MNDFLRSDGIAVGRREVPLLMEGRRTADTRCWHYIRDRR